MEPTHIFINGCSFLTYRSKDGIMTHAGKELEKLMGLARGGHLAGGGRGNKRVSITTKIWCQKNPELAKKCFFVICLLYTSPSPRDRQKSRMPSSA